MHIKSILYFERNIVPSGNFFWMFLIESECTDWVEIHRGFAGNNPRTPGHMWHRVQTQKQAAYSAFWALPVLGKKSVYQRCQDLTKHLKCDECASTLLQETFLSLSVPPSPALSRSFSLSLSFSLLSLSLSPNLSLSSSIFLCFSFCFSFPVSFSFTLLFSFILWVASLSRVSALSLSLCVTVIFPHAHTISVSCLNIPLQL